MMSAAGTGLSMMSVAGDSGSATTATLGTSAKVSRPSISLADGEELAGSEASSTTDDIIDFLDTINERNHDTMPDKIGLIKSLEGEELRIVLCKVDTKEYVNIRGTVLPYTELKGVFNDFEFMKETYNQLQKTERDDLRTCLITASSIVCINLIFFFLYSQ
jgi:hypothetical protein